MKIVELKANNVKRLTAVSIKPDGSTVIVGGQNGAGKSSVLDSIIYGLGGTKGIPGQPIRNGEKSASITIKLEGERNLVVTRNFREGGKSSLEVVQVDDAGRKLKVASPQKMLDELYSAIAFDPLAFTRLVPANQADMLRQVLGVDVEDLDTEAAVTYADRTEVNRRIKGLQANFDSLTLHDDAPDEEVSVAALIEELKAAQVHNRNVRDLEDIHEGSIRECDAKRHTIKSAMGSEEELKLRIGKVRECREEAESQLSGLVATANLNAKIRSEATCVDESIISEKITNADKTNTAVRENKTRTLVSKEIAEQQGFADEATEKLSSLKEQRLKRLAEVDWPVDGLSFGANGVTFNGLPFEQCSSAEQLRISTAIGLAQNPELKVMLIHDGSLLDDSSLAEITRMAEEADAQVWIERVGDGEECSVIIEDGTAVSEVVDSPALATA